MVRVQWRQPYLHSLAKESVSDFLDILLSIKKNYGQEQKNSGYKINTLQKSNKKCYIIVSISLNPHLNQMGTFQGLTKFICLTYVMCSVKEI